MAPQIQGA